jgi:tRNA pseudouridine55 synthase
MHGVVNLDKPVGPTSHDMVGLMRRLTGTRRIGHAGTLDPLASGVLPILIGSATRFSEDLTGGQKRYDAVIRLGQRSATDDAEGELIAVDGPLPSEREVRAALGQFVGTFAQRPPAFSARKIAGRAAHRAARAGQAPELPAREVTVESIDLLSLAPGDGWLDARVDIRCGAGTYVRSIARDVGEALGCGGHLHALRRTEAAGLHAEDAWPPERLNELASAGRLADALIPVGALLRLPRLTLPDEEAARFRHGGRLRLRRTDAPGDGRHAVYQGEQLIGIGTMDHGLLQPDKVVVP